MCKAVRYVQSEEGRRRGGKREKKKREEERGRRRDQTYLISFQFRRLDQSEKHGQSANTYKSTRQGREKNTCVEMWEATVQLPHHFS
jgi:hypothetical protein